MSRAGVVLVCALLAACQGSLSPNTASLAVDPDPLPVCDGGVHGRVRISWFREGMDPVEVRVGTIDGALFVAGSPHGAAWTGDWVTDGMAFYLVDAASGAVLASTSARIDSDCESSR